MGIKNLRSIVPEETVKERQVSDYFGYWIAIDTSMFLYQSLVAIRKGGEALVDDQGNATSHLQGLFWRSIRFIEKGIKPVFVFDGKPPELKSGELQKRRERKEAAEKRVVESKEEGNKEEQVKAAKQTVHLGREQVAEAKKLLRLMGLPVVEAPCEAEATCVQMCKDGLVHAVATDDMDALTFGCPRLVRRFMAPEKKKLSVLEFRTEAIIEALGITMQQFIDVCILCGCDYTGTIPGIGPKSALSGIIEGKNIEGLISGLSEKRRAAYAEVKAKDGFMYQQARDLFNSPVVVKADEVRHLLKIERPNRDGLIQFLCDEKMFSPERVESGVKRLEASKGKAGQTRLDSFFKVSQTPSTTPRKVGKKAPKRVTGKPVKKAVKKKI